MMKEKLQDQAFPGSVGGAIGVIWTIYGEWLGMIPPDLGDIEQVSLTGAVGIFATAIVNLIRRLVYPNQTIQLTDAGERRAQEEITS